jgi:hypothetical protein
MTEIEEVWRYRCGILVIMRDTRGKNSFLRVYRGFLNGQERG